MFNLLKTAVYAAVCCLAVGATAQAQYTYSYPSYYYPTYNQNDPGYEMDFDSQTGTLTISGTTNDDICTVDMPYGNYISVNLKQVSGNTTTDLDTMYFFYYELKSIVFEGNDGDDNFSFTPLAISRMQYLENVTSLFELTCDLRGGQGFDCLEGGIGDDILDGGADGIEDMLLGRDGADIFVDHREAHTYYYYGTYPYTVYGDEEHENDIDFNPFFDGDIQMFADEIEVPASVLDVQNARLACASG